MGLLTYIWAQSVPSHWVKMAPRFTFFHLKGTNSIFSPNYEFFCCCKSNKITLQAVIKGYTDVYWSKWNPSRWVIFKCYGRYQIFEEVPPPPGFRHSFLALLCCSGWTCRCSCRFNSHGIRYVPSAVDRWISIPMLTDFIILAKLCHATGL